MDRGVVTTERVQTTRLADGKKMVNHYVLDERIGKGMHGTVFKCHDHLNENKIFAMKIVKRDTKKAQRERQYKQLRNRNSMPPRTDHVPVVDGIRTAEQEIRKEIAIMKKCRHPHVVRLYEVIDDRKNDQIFMVMEHLGGGEIKYTNGENQPILTVDQSRRIMRDAILGLEYLHHQGIIHRDIKPANLIWTSNHDRVKIADFGTAHFSYAQHLSAAAQDGTTASRDQEDPILLNDADLAKRAGSPAFLAPEIVWEYTDPPSSLRPPVTKAIDIWALGVTLYCLLFGKIPFRPPGMYSLNEWTGYQYVCNHDWRAPSKMGYDEVPTGGRHPSEEAIERGEVGPTVIHLLDHFLKKDMDERITLEEVKTNRWFLQDLPNPSTWLEITSPNPIQVSAKETSDAMSTLRFRWAMGMGWGRRGAPGAAGTSTSTGTATGTTSMSTRARGQLPATVAARPGVSVTTGSYGGISIKKRLVALLSRGATPTLSPTPSSTSSTSTVANLFGGLRVHRSQGAIGSPEKKDKGNKSKPKIKSPIHGADDDMADRGRVISEPTMRLRRVKSDRDAEAERERRDKKERERERRRRKKMAKAANTSTPIATQQSLSTDRKGKQREQPIPVSASSSKALFSTPRIAAPTPKIASPAAVRPPPAARTRSDSIRSIRSFRGSGNANSEQRSASPSGKRLTGLFSSIAHWRPSSRGSHYSQSGYASPPGTASGCGSPVEERDPGRERSRFKGKQKSKDKGRAPDDLGDTTVTATTSTATAVTVTGKPTKGSTSDESDIEFADPNTYTPAIVSPPLIRPGANGLLSSSADELPQHLDTWVPSPPPSSPNARGPASSSSRSSSSAALFAASGSGSASGRSASPTAPPVLSRAPASAVMLNNPAGATLAATVIAISGGALVAEGSIGSVDSSNSSLGGIANRRISSWDQGAGAAADARSLTSYQSDEFDDEDDFVVGEDGYHVTYREQRDRDIIFGAGGIGRRDEVMAAHSSSNGNVFGSRTPNGSSRGQTSRPQSGIGHRLDGTAARPGGGGIIIMSDEVDSYGGWSDDEYDEEEQGTYEGTTESTVEAQDEEVSPHNYGYGYGSGPREAAEDEDEGLVFSTKRRRDDQNH
uniref:Putative other/CAMKK/ELM protein kinase n=1 Tax=Moniliophthora roreri TaxID=221103 RepID=A0A0W0EUM7_MONRR